MSQELAEMTALPFKVELQGKEYTLSNMTLGLYAELQQWAEKQLYKKLHDRLKALPADSEDKDIREIRQQLKDKIVNISQGEIRFEIATIMNSAEGAAYQLFLMLKKNHPEIKSPEDCKHLVTFERFNQLQKLVEGDVDEGDKKSPPAQS